MEKRYGDVLMHKETSELFVLIHWGFTFLEGDKGRYYLRWDDNSFTNLGKL